MALFCYPVKKWPGAFAAVVRGLDTLVFAEGIGENALTVRARICEGLGFLGIALEERRHAETAGVISTHASRATVRVICTDEELMMARSVCRTPGLGMPSEKRHSDHATNYISRLDPFFGERRASLSSSRTAVWVADVTSRNQPNESKLIWPSTPSAA